MLPRQHYIDILRGQNNILQRQKNILMGQKSLLDGQMGLGYGQEAILERQDEITNKIIGLYPTLNRMDQHILRARIELLRAQNVVVSKLELMTSNINFVRNEVDKINKIKTLYFEFYF